MSLNNVTTATGLMPQFATNPATGQIFMIAPNQHQLGVQYFLPRPFLEAPHTLPPPQPIQHRIIPHQQHPQIQLPATQPKQIQAQPPPQSKDQTNAKVRGIKEKCITHYIDGQLIIETSKPLTEKKLKSSKKKKTHQQSQAQAQPSMQLQTPMQPQQSIQRHSQGQTQQAPSRQQTPPMSQPQQLQIHHQPQVQPSSQPISQTLSQSIVKQQPKNQQLPQQQSPQPQSNKKTHQKQTQDHHQSSNEVQSLRAEMPHWSVAEVVEFIERHEDIRQYSSKFAEDEVDGKALLLMIDRNLNFQILTSMFKHGPAMKIEATLSKYKIND